MSRVELDQSVQAELNARNSWIGAQERHKRSMDAFKLTLGLPADASVELDRDELVRLAQRAGDSKLALAMRDQQAVPAKPVPATAPIELIPPSREEAGPLEMEERRAIDLALANRLDLRAQHGLVIDAQRAVVVAANALEADLTLVASGSTGSGRGLGSSGLSSATHLRADNAEYAFSANFDLPWERTAERNAYRRSYIALEAAARDVQELEDRVKLDIRNGLRDLLLARETYKIQTQAVALATRRVESSRLFLEAGRVQIRDLLEAEDALLGAQNALTAAIVGYRVSELRLQRDMGVLEVNDKGLWREYAVNTP